MPWHMGIGGQKGVGVISGLWAWCPFRASVVFLDPDEFCCRRGFTLPSIQIVKDDCKDLVVCNNFLYDTSRRGYDGHVVSVRRVWRRLGGEYSLESSHRLRVSGESGRSSVTLPN